MGFWRTSASLYWCSYCGVPTLEPKCGSCGGDARTLHAAPPKDLRPAFEHDLGIVKSVVAAEYGNEAVEALIPSGKLVLLNKVSHVDQANEVIVDGWPVGKLFFNPDEARWRFKLDAEGAARLLSLKLGSYVTVETGKVRLWQTLSESSPSEGPLEAGRYVIVASKRGQAVGLAVRTDSGLKMVKAWAPQKPHWSSASSSLSKALKANEEALVRLERRAIAFVKMVEAKVRKPSLISFSGGKDSLATLTLVLKAVGDKPLLFNDTGLEMPETVEHVKHVASKLGLKLVVAEAGEAFWSHLKSFGPPSRDYRWCCKVCKLIPISREVKRLHPELWKRWEDWLKSWAEQHGLPAAWVTYGFWRWQTLPGDQRKLIKRLGLSLNQLSVKPEAPVRVVKLSGYAPCAGEYTVEAVVNRPLDIEGVAGLAPLIGSFKLSVKLQTLIVKRNESTVSLHASGRVIVRAKAKGEAEGLLKLCLTILSRSMLCNACSSCVNWCEKGAIRLEAGKPVIDVSLCVRCYACNKACPVASYLAKRVVEPLTRQEALAANNA